VIVRAVISNEMPVVCIQFTGLRHTIEEKLT
jgi:hypothetical protein